MSRREVSIAFQSDKSPGEYSELAGIVEQAGFDLLSIYSDLFYQPPIVPLTLAALATSRIRLGPSALNPYTLHPVEIAGQIATLDQVSGGRAYLGLVRGAWLEELGIAQRRPLATLRECIDVVQQLLEGRQSAYAGDVFRLDAHHRRRYDVERTQVPLLIGSWGAQTLRLAGARADEVKVGGSTNPDMVPVARARIDAGHDGTREVGLCFGAVTVVDDDGAAARAWVRREMALYLPVIAALDPTVTIDPELLSAMQGLVDAGDTAAAGALVPDDLLTRFAFAGTPAEVIGQAEALFSAGATRVEFGTPHGLSTARGLNLLSEVVLPALRG